MSQQFFVSRKKSFGIPHFCSLLCCLLFKSGKLPGSLLSMHKTFSQIEYRRIHNILVQLPTQTYQPCLKIFPKCKHSSLFCAWQGKKCFVRVRICRSIIHFKWSWLTLKYQTSMKMISKCKHSSLICPWQGKNVL